MKSDENKKEEEGESDFNYYLINVLWTDFIFQDTVYQMNR